MQHFTFALPLSTKSPRFHVYKKCPSWSRNPEPPENPSNLPENRLKCLRRIYLRSKVP